MASQFSDCDIGLPTDFLKKLLSNPEGYCCDTFCLTEKCSSIRNNCSVIPGSAVPHHVAVVTVLNMNPGICLYLLIIIHLHYLYALFVNTTLQIWAVHEHCFIFPRVYLVFVLID